MATKYSKIMNDLEARQAKSLDLFHKTAALIKEAQKAGYVECDCAFDSLKDAATSFLNDANATHSTS